MCSDNIYQYTVHLICIKPVGCTGTSREAYNEMYTHLQMSLTTR